MTCSAAGAVRIVARGIRRRRRRRQSMRHLVHARVRTSGGGGGRCTGIWRRRHTANGHILRTFVSLNHRRPAFRASRFVPDRPERHGRRHRTVAASPVILIAFACVHHLSNGRPFGRSGAPGASSLSAGIITGRVRCAVLLHRSRAVMFGEPIRRT